MEEKYVEVDGQKFVDDGTGIPKVGEDGQQIPFVEEKTVPYSRFKEVNDGRKQLEERIKTLEEKKQDTGLTTDEKKELEAKQYLEKLVNETVEKREKTQKEKEEHETATFKREVDEILDLNPDVKRAEFAAFLEKEADKYGVESVKGAMTLYKDLQKLKTETTDKTKKEIAAKPKSLQPGGGGGEINWAEKDKGKSLSQIASEVIKDLKE